MGERHRQKSISRRANSGAAILHTQGSSRVVCPENGGVARRQAVVRHCETLESAPGACARNGTSVQNTTTAVSYFVLTLQEAAFPPLRALATSDTASLLVVRCLRTCFGARRGITGAALSMTREGWNGFLRYSREPAHAQKKAPGGALYYGCQCAHRSQLGALSLPYGFGLRASSGDWKRC